MLKSLLLQSMILIEIQDTMAQPPAEEKSMKRATHVGIAITVSALSELKKNPPEYLWQMRAVCLVLRTLAKSSLSISLLTLQA